MIKILKIHHSFYWILRFDFRGREPIGNEKLNYRCEEKNQHQRKWLVGPLFFWDEASSQTVKSNLWETQSNRFESLLKLLKKAETLFTEEENEEEEQPFTDARFNRGFIALEIVLLPSIFLFLLIILQL